MAQCVNVHKNKVAELCSCDKIVAAIVRTEDEGCVMDVEAEAGGFP